MFGWRIFLRTETSLVRTATWLTMHDLLMHLIATRSPEDLWMASFTSEKAPVPRIFSNLKYFSIETFLMGEVFCRCWALGSLAPPTIEVEVVVGIEFGFREVDEEEEDDDAEGCSAVLILLLFG